MTEKEMARRATDIQIGIEAEDGAVEWDDALWALHLMNATDDQEEIENLIVTFEECLYEACWYLDNIRELEDFFTEQFPN